MRYPVSDKKSACMRFTKKEYLGLVQCLLALDKLDLAKHDRKTFDDVYKYVYNDRLTQKGLQLLDNLCEYYRVPLFERKEDKKDKTAGSRWSAPQDKRIEFIRDQLRQDEATTITKRDLIVYHLEQLQAQLEAGVITKKQFDMMLQPKSLQVKHKPHPVEVQAEIEPDILEEAPSIPEPIEPEEIVTTPECQALAEVPTLPEPVKLDAQSYWEVQQQRNEEIAGRKLQAFVDEMTKAAEEIITDSRVDFEVQLFRQKEVRFAKTLAISAISVAIDGNDDEKRECAEAIVDEQIDQLIAVRFPDMKINDAA